MSYHTSPFDGLPGAVAALVYFPTLANFDWAIAAEEFIFTSVIESSAGTAAPVASLAAVTASSFILAVKTSSVPKVLTPSVTFVIAIIYSLLEWWADKPCDQ